MRALTLAILFCLAVLLGLAWSFSDTTVYAPGYSEAKFRAIRTGMSEAEVIRTLGQPLSVDPAVGYIVWTYGPGDDRNPQTPATAPWDISATTTFTGDVKGKVTAIDGAYLDTKESRLIGRRLADVRERYGKPLEVWAAPDRKMFWYSKLSGTKGQYVRSVDIDNLGQVRLITAGRIGYYVSEEFRQNLG